MAKRINRALSFDKWPSLDQQLFRAAHPQGDIFDIGTNSHLSARTVYARRSSYGQFLMILMRERADQLVLQPHERVTPENLELCLLCLRRNCTEHTVANFLQRLYLVVRSMYPRLDWRWMQSAQRSVQRSARPLRHREVLSHELYAVGLRLIEVAKKDVAEGGAPTLKSAEMLRDGLMIALLAEQPMRRGELASLSITEHLSNIGDRFVLNLPPELVKCGAARHYRVSQRLSNIIRLYLLHFRPLFPNATEHAGMWPYKDRPMTDKMIRRCVRRHTAKALGYAVTPHRFRNAAATFTSVVDPKNIRMAKDLLGHSSLFVTEQHYVDGSRSRLAGRQHAEAWATLLNRLEAHNANKLMR